MPLRRQPYRVLHVIKGLGRGGAEMLLPQAMAAGGGDFTYSVGYFLPWKDALVDDCRRAGAAVTCFGGRSTAAVLARVPAVARFVRRTQVDLVHAHLPVAGVVARLAALLAGVPIVYTEHNVQARYHGITRALNIATWGLQRHVVAVSAEVADSARRRMGERAPISVIRNGIDVDRFRAVQPGREALRTSLGIPPSTPVVGTVAVLRSQKRLDLWVDTASRVRARCPEARFLLVGDGPMAAQVTSWIRSAGLDACVVRPGLQQDVAPFLAAMDVFLITSEYEGLPLALLEAMAAGLPVVSTAVGGIPEVLADGQTGFVIRFPDVPALAAAVSDLLRDAAARQRIGSAAASSVAAGFGVGRMAREIEALYAGVLKTATREG